MVVQLLDAAKDSVRAFARSFDEVSRLRAKAKKVLRKLHA
jgi:hypothetical protein